MTLKNNAYLKKYEQSLRRKYKKQRERQKQLVAHDKKTQCKSISKSHFDIVATQINTIQLRYEYTQIILNNARQIQTYY